MPLAWNALAQGQDATAGSALEQRRERLRQKWEQQFRAADSDGDGFLSLEECRAARFPAAIIDHFNEIDSDGDGRLSPAELLALYQRRLDAQQAQAPP